MKYLSILVAAAFTALVMGCSATPNTAGHVAAGQMSAVCCDSATCDCVCDGCPEVCGGDCANCEQCVANGCCQNCGCASAAACCDGGACAAACAGCAKGECSDCLAGNCAPCAAAGCKCCA